MSEKSPQKNHPDFSSLSDIMAHFSRVPLDQFQSDLNEWFYTSLNEKGIDLCKLNGEDTAGFPEQLKQFVKGVYKQAEISHQKGNNK